ncbi:MAG: hypothetical protein ACR2LN_01750 [Candidatus Levyibacteriota bacterium]
MKYLNEGIEIIGKSPDSGYTIPLYLIRTSEGKFIQLTTLLFYTVVALQKEKKLKAVAQEVSLNVGKIVDTQIIKYLMRTKLAPLGIIRDSNPASQQEQKSTNIILSLTYHFTLIPEHVAQFLAKLFTPLFYPFVIGVVLTSFVEVNIWLFMTQDLGNAVQQIIYQPSLFLLLVALVLLGTLFHEIGHATGCEYSGGKPSRIGAGLYIVWPAFFTDITDVYRLNRAARLRSDVGGIYFNAIFSLLATGIYFLTHFEPLLLLIVFQNIEILQQLLPFLRLDGYYIVSDIVGVPNLFAHIKPILFSLLPGQAQAAPKNLKRWVRWVVTTWVLLTIPTLIYLFWVLFTDAPHLMTTTWSSVLLQMKAMQENLNSSNYVIASIRGLQLLIIILPVLGIFAMSFRFGKKGLEILSRVSGNLLVRR